MVNKSQKSNSRFEDPSDATFIGNKGLVLDHIDLVDKLNVFIRNIEDRDEENAVDYYNKKCLEDSPDSHIEECNHYSSKEKQRKINQTTDYKIQNIK